MNGLLKFLTFALAGCALAVAADGVVECTKGAQRGRPEVLKLVERSSQSY